MSIIKRPFQRNLQQNNQLTPFELIRIAELDDIAWKETEQLKELQQMKEQLKNGFSELIEKIQTPAPVAPVAPPPVITPSLSEPNKKFPILNYAYPATGEKSVAAGTTIIRFHEGSVELPGGTVENITGSTAKLPWELMCKSVGIEVDTAVDILIADEFTTGEYSEKLKRTLSPVRTVYRGLEFDYLEITTSRTTQLYIEASSDRDGVPDMQLARGEEVLPLASDKDEHFTEAITMNNQETESIAGLLSNKIYIHGVNIQSVQALKYRLIFWWDANFDDTDIDVDSYAGHVELDMTSSPAFRIDSANQYYLDVGDLAFAYEDRDATNKIHCSLQNLSATAKIAGSSGAVQLDFKYSPRL